MNYEGKLWPGDGEQMYLSSAGASTSTKAQVIVVYLSGAFRCAFKRTVYKQIHRNLNKMNPMCKEDWAKFPPQHHQKMVL